MGQCGYFKCNECGYYSEINVGRGAEPIIEESVAREKLQNIYGQTLSTCMETAEEPTLHVDNAVFRCGFCRQFINDVNISISYYEKEEIIEKKFLIKKKRVIRKYKEDFRVPVKCPDCQGEMDFIMDEREKGEIPCPKCGVSGKPLMIAYWD